MQSFTNVRTDKLHHVMINGRRQLLCDRTEIQNLRFKQEVDNFWTHVWEAESMLCMRSYRRTSVADTVIHFGGSLKHHMTLYFPFAIDILNTGKNRVKLCFALWLPLQLERANRKWCDVSEEIKSEWIVGGAAVRVIHEMKDYWSTHSSYSGLPVSAITDWL